MTELRVQDDVTEGVAALMPRLKRQAAFALALDCLAVAAGTLIIYWAVSSGVQDRLHVRTEVLTPFLVLSAILAIHSWMLKRQQAIMIPVLAQSIGLRYDMDASAFVRRFPERLLPMRGSLVGEDHLVAVLGAHELQMSELSVVTGSKKHDTVFRGIAAWFPNRAPLPAFFLFQDRKTRNGAIIPRELSADGLHHLRDVTSARRTYGIWTSQPLDDEPPGLAPLVDALLRIEERLDKATELYSARSSGDEVHLLLSHNRNLFNVGGAFLNKARLFKHVQSALQDLTVPLTLAEALIQAEEIAVAKS